MEVVTAIGGAVGNAILSVSVEKMLDKLTSMDLIKYAGEQKIFDEIKKWENKLKKIYVVLDDAEEKQWVNPLVKMWVSELRGLAYDVEDVLDELATEAQLRKLKEEPPAQASKVRRILSTVSACLNLNTVKFSADMVSKIERVSERLDEIIKERDDLHLKEFTSGMGQVRSRLQTTSLVNEAKIYGREKAKEEILHLLKEEASDVKAHVIPIVGMGGIGKTTLAQLVFNDVTLDFDFKAWVSVGEDFDVQRITKTILQSHSSDEDLNSLQMTLKKKLLQEKCLVVLDDVWMESYDHWSLFYSPFEVGAPGSRIIVTTRNQSVSLMMGTVPAYFLKELPADDCLVLFAQCALGAANFDDHLHLKEIGTEIVRRCCGLPLAAKALGGMLRSNPNSYVWEEVLNSNIWDLPDNKCNILPALRLSYFHLPSHLKQCFAYCAMFPKDFEFKRNELVLLWMAEGFVNQPKKMHESGCQYFDDLLSRSFFQQSSNDKSRYVMHDLIHDLAQSVSRETCFHLGDKWEDTNSREKIRHFSFICGEYDTREKFKDLSKMKSLRTFSSLPLIVVHWNSINYLTSLVMHDMVPKLKCLRVLSLSGYHMPELPSSIGALKRLRYLNLSDANFERLPESIVDLVNLQTLRLQSCSRLAELPSGIGNLINLQWLEIMFCYSLNKLPLGICNLTNLLCLEVSLGGLRELPPQIGNLKNLHILSDFIVGKDNGLKLTELMKLSKLQGDLCIKELQNVVDIQDAEVADLKEKHGLERLELAWASDSNGSRNPSEEVEVLKSLRPSYQNLSSITIFNFGGIEFPSWIGDPAFNKMVKLSLSCCRNIKLLPPLGQLPSLRELKISNMEGVKEVGVELFGEGSSCFDSLETLSFEQMEEWEKWLCSSNDDLNMDSTAVRFPKLRHLQILSCQKLVGKLPSCLPSLQDLLLSGCQGALLRTMSGFTSLTTAEINDISGLVSLDEAHIEDLVALEHLRIGGWDDLTFLWKDGTNADKLISLKGLTISTCHQLVSLVEGEEGKFPCNLQVLRIVFCNKLKSFPARGVPYGLKHLTISSCESLESVPKGIILSSDGNQIMSQLEELTISDCPSLTSSPHGQLPDSILSMECSNWPTQLFASLCTTISLAAASPNSFSRLTQLEIANCSQLESFPGSGLTIHTLTSLFISNCDDLRSLPDWMHNLSSLESLHISNCNNLRSLPNWMPKLSSLRINYCNSFMLFSPNQMGNLTYLEIRDCGGLESLSLPPKLTYLWIQNCENLRQPISDWGLHELTCLSKLMIRGTIPGTDKLDSFPDNHGLPNSLTCIELSDFGNLKSISSGIISLASLIVLKICDCPNLQSFPKEGFPPTLGLLCIQNCPLIKEWCLKHRGGDHRSIVSHIPSVRIDEVHTSMDD